MRTLPKRSVSWERSRPPGQSNSNPGTLAEMQMALQEHSTMKYPKRRPSQSSRASNTLPLTKVGCLVFPFIYFCLFSWQRLNILKTTKPAADVRGTASSPASSDTMLDSLCPPKPSTHLSPSSVPPIWIPGYPGSGSELLRDLLQSGTRHPAHDIYYEEYCQGGITCKTHWPAFDDRDPRNLTKPHLVFDNTRAWLLLRQPSAALPSYRNFLYEVNHNMTDHSQQAPEHAWISWRNRRFNRDMNRWANMIRTWFNDTSSPVPITLIVGYEDLVDSRQGPVLMQQMHEQLKSAQSRHALHDVGDEIPSSWTLQDMHCAWKYHVLERPGKKRTSRGYKPRFTIDQYQTMHQTLVDLQQEFPHQAQLCSWLQRYQREVERDLKLALDTQKDALSATTPVVSP